MSEARCVTHNACLRCASLGLGCCSRCRPFILARDLCLLLEEYPVEKIESIVEVDVIPEMYLHHLLDSEMKQIYYFWGSAYYRLQTKFLRGSCAALMSSKGCILGDHRPLICKVWPFWWKNGTNLSEGDFPIEVNGDCTMVTIWNMTIKEILGEFGYSEDALRKDLLTMSKALREHGEILREAAKRRVPPNKLLDWILNII
ncbi:MAG: hypothetical protein QXX99_04820 [Candidatus Bathyarchaeia archaeon]